MVRCSGCARGMALGLVAVGTAPSTRSTHPPRVCSHDRRADDLCADDCAADVLALDTPDDGSHATAGSGYAYGMGLSTKCMRHGHRHAARACNVCVCTQYICVGTPQVLTGYCTGNSRGADIGTDAVLMDSVLTEYSAC
jgi:hypothetical protein